MRSTLVIAILCGLQLPAPSKGARLERMTTADAAQVLTADSVVVIPLGAGLQPHAAHLSLGSDLTLAEHLAHRLMEAANVAVAPALAYHPGNASKESAGAATLGSETARDATVDIVRMLSRAGPRRFYLLNTSTAIQPLQDAAAILARDGILLRFTDFTAHVGAHGKERETSMLLHIDAPAVNMERADGDSSSAAAARGKIFLDTLVDVLVREVEALRRARPPEPQPIESSPPAPPSPPPPPAEPRRPSGCTAGDERAIAEVANRFSAYWTMGDVNRIADLWAEEGDLAHPDGVVERGREIIRANRRDQFRRPEYRGSKHGVRFGVIRCVSADVAVADGKWDLSGVLDAAGNAMPRGEGPTTVVLKKHGGSWLFEAYRYSVALGRDGAKPPTLLKKPGYPDK